MGQAEEGQQELQRLRAFAEKVHSWHGVGSEQRFPQWDEELEPLFGMDEEAVSQYWAREAERAMGMEAGSEPGETERKKR